MVRAVNKSVTAARKKRLRKLTKGFRLARHNLFRQAKVTLLRAGVFAFRDRRAKKRMFRRLWIIRINAACRKNGLSYSRLIAGLKAAAVEVDRKMLAALALDDPQAFGELAALAKRAAPGPAATKRAAGATA